MGSTSWISRGGMGDYRVIVANRIYALKVLAALGEDDQSARLRREMRTAASLNDPIS